MADKAGGILARVGTPAGASVAVDVAGVKSVVDTVNTNVDQSLSTTESNLMGASGTHKDIIDALAAVGTLTGKEKAFMGSFGQPTLNEYFATVGSLAVPDTAKWNVVEDNDAVVRVHFGATDVRCEITAGSVGDNDAYINTVGMFVWDFVNLLKDELHFRTRIQCDDTEGEYGFGFCQSPLSANFYGTVNPEACVHCNNDVINFNTSDGIIETTAISAEMAEGSYHTVELILTAGTSVKCIVDDVLLATHTARLPDLAMPLGFATRNKNGVQTDMDVLFAEVWTE